MGAGGQRARPTARAQPQLLRTQGGYLSIFEGFCFSIFASDHFAESAIKPAKPRLPRLLCLLPDPVQT